MAVAITRMELDAAGLRAAAAQQGYGGVAPDAGAGSVLEGSNRTEAAQAAGMDRQKPRDWVHRYNEARIAGLHNKPKPGAPPRQLTAEQGAAVAEWVRQGPTLEQHKVVRWRLVDLRDEIARRFGVQLHERRIGKLMARLNFSRVSVRPCHPEQDAAAQETHKNDLPSWSPPRSPSTRVTNRSSCGGRMVERRRSNVSAKAA